MDTENTALFELEIDNNVDFLNIYSLFDSTADENRAKVTREYYTELKRLSATGKGCICSSLAVGICDDLALENMRHCHVFYNLHSTDYRYKKAIVFVTPRDDQQHDKILACFMLDEFSGVKSFKPIITFSAKNSEHVECFDTK